MILQVLSYFHILGVLFFFSTTGVPLYTGIADRNFTFYADFDVVTSSIQATPFASSI